MTYPVSFSYFSLYGFWFLYEYFDSHHQTVTRVEDSIVHLQLDACMVGPRSGKHFLKTQVGWSIQTCFMQGKGIGWVKMLLVLSAERCNGSDRGWWQDSDGGWWQRMVTEDGERGCWWRMVNGDKGPWERTVTESDYSRQLQSIPPFQTPQLLKPVKARLYCFWTYLIFE